VSIKGNPLTSLVRVDGYPRFRQDGQSAALEDRYAVLWTSWLSAMPPIGAESDYISGLYLSERAAERDGEMANVTLIYKFPDANEPILDGADGYESRSGVMPAEVVSKTPTIIWIRRKRVTTFARTEANMTLNVGKRVDPPGITSPTAICWLKIGRDVQDRLGYTDIEDSYEWFPGGWPATYGDGTGE